jgi:hypothetical protein
MRPRVIVSIGVILVLSSLADSAALARRITRQQERANASALWMLERQRRVTIRLGGLGCFVRAWLKRGIRASDPRRINAASLLPPGGEIRSASSF